MESGGRSSMVVYNLQNSNKGQLQYGENNKQAFPLGSGDHLQNFKDAWNERKTDVLEKSLLLQNSISDLANSEYSSPLRLGYGEDSGEIPNELGDGSYTIPNNDSPKNGAKKLVVAGHEDDTNVQINKRIAAYEEERIKNVQSAVAARESHLTRQLNSIREDQECQLLDRLSQRRQEDKLRELAEKQQEELQKTEAERRLVALEETHKHHSKLVSERMRQVEAQRAAAEQEKQERMTQIRHLVERQLEYRKHKMAIATMLRACGDKDLLRANCEAPNARFRVLGESLHRLFEIARTRLLTDAELQAVDDALLGIAQLVPVFHAQIENVNNILQTKADQLAEASAASVPTAEVAPSTQEVPSTENANPAVTENTNEVKKSASNIAEVIIGCSDLDSFQRYINLQRFHSSFQDSIQIANEYKRFVNDCKKAVNTPVNAISSVSASHLEDKLVRLHRLLAGHSVEVGGGTRVNAADHPSGIRFCISLLATKFVRQGDTMVSSKPESAFPIAAIIVALWCEHPEFGQLLLAQFHQVCPYLVPYYPPQREGMSDEDYYRALGYDFTDGQVERQDKFLKRMSGIARLYAAILVTPVRRSTKKAHPHDISNAWRWIAAVINLDPRPDITATLLFDFLEVAGSSLFKEYGRQFQKMLHVLCTEFFPKLKKAAFKGTGGPVIRLENFLQRSLKHGTISPPPGHLPSNFW